MLLENPSAFPGWINQILQVNRKNKTFQIANQQKAQKICDSMDSQSIGTIDVAYSEQSNA